MGIHWDRSDVIGLAMEQCAYCHGTGVRRGRGSGSSTCACVFRAVFRACYARFRYCVEKEKDLSKVCLVARQGKDRRLSYERLIEDYIADFYLVSRRYLDTAEYRLFRFHYLLGADWRLCCRQLQIDRGTFFHSVYRIQQKLGRVYRDLKPYGLFPLDEYFAGRLNGTAAQRPDLVISIRRAEPVRPPLRKVA